MLDPAENLFYQILLDPAKTTILQELVRSYHFLVLTKVTCKNRFLGMIKKDLAHIKHRGGLLK
jgi:hypothetical protein